MGRSDTAGPSGSPEEPREADPTSIGQQRVDQIVAEDAADGPVLVVHHEQGGAVAFRPRRGSRRITELVLVAEGHTHNR